MQLNGKALIPESEDFDSQATVRDTAEVAEKVITGTISSGPTLPSITKASLLHALVPGSTAPRATKNVNKRATETVNVPTGH